MDLNEICSVEPCVGGGYLVVLYSAVGDRYTIGSFNDKIDADAIARRLGLFVQTWISDATQ